MSSEESSWSPTVTPSDRFLGDKLNIWIHFTLLQDDKSVIVVNRLGLDEFLMMDFLVFTVLWFWKFNWHFRKWNSFHQGIYQVNVWKLWQNLTRDPYLRTRECCIFHYNTLTCLQPPWHSWHLSRTEFRCKFEAGSPFVAQWPVTKRACSLNLQTNQSFRRQTHVLLKPTFHIHKTAALVDSAQLHIPENSE